jgi:hypothetical protein
LLVAASVVSLGFLTQAPAWAQGNRTGFSEQEGQGNLENDNVRDNPGTASVSGPKGQIDKGNVDCNNCEQDLPGNNR